MDLTENESKALRITSERFDDLRLFLQAQQQPAVDSTPLQWFSYLAELKHILGNFSNELSLVACLMAKDYLCTRLSLTQFDVALKPQGANGLDIDELTTNGERVIGEIKTTTPYKKSQFGAAQLTAFRKDFAKLHLNDADHKFLFVTDSSAFGVLKTEYSSELSGIKVVCLTSGEEHLA